MICKGKILEAAKITPPYVNFGRIIADASSQITVAIERADGGPLRPTVGPITTQGLSAKLKEIEPGRRYELVVALTPPLKRGRLWTNITLSTGVPQAPTIDLPVFGVVADPQPTQPAGSSPAPTAARTEQQRATATQPHAP